MMRWLIELEDRARANGLVRLALCEEKLHGKRRPAVNDHQALARYIVRLCEAARLATNERLMRNIEDQIRECVRQLDVREVNWGELIPNFDNPRIPKAAVLKRWVSTREKGVVLVNYESQYARLLRLPDLKGFAAHYTLIIGPSWYPPHSLVNCVFAEAYPDKVFSLISNARELEILPRFSPKLVPLPLYGSSWVNPLLYKPLPPTQRDIDILMVANWGKFKRHHALFHALRRIPENVRVLLIGQDQDGRTAETIREEARAYGVEKRFSLITDAGYSEVTQAYCRSRMSVILSRREGSCVAVAESLFADTPVAIYEDAVIGSRAFVNEATGMFLRHADLASQLMEFLAKAKTGQYSPRQWADANISCFQSARILNNILRQHALDEGGEWTEDVAAVTWCPDQQLALPEDRLRLLPERELIKTRFGIELGQAN